MELTFLKNGNNAVKTTTRLALIYCIVISGAFISGYYFIAKEISSVSEKMILIDTRGQVLESSVINSGQGRIFEYENHVRLFYTYWYSFSESSFKNHINAGLNLIGEKGKELYNEYKDQNVERLLSEKNLQCEVQITDIKIDMNTLPVSGYIEGIQTIRRAKGIISRKLNVKFTLYDTDSRTRDNIHACKIDDWEIYESSVIKNDENGNE